MLKKGAMFGLDARIALAIFGALSVISGAALYSAIQAAKVEQANQYFSELAKSIEQNYLDTGRVVPHYNSQSVLMHDIVENTDSISSWNGPYFDAVKEGSGSLITPLNRSFGDGSTVFSAFLSPISAWSSNTAVNLCASVGDKDCAIYLTLNTDVSAENTYQINNIFKVLDEKYDGGDGDLAGKIRLVKFSADRYILMYRTIQTQRLL